MRNLSAALAILSLVCSTAWPQTYRQVPLPRVLYATIEANLYPSSGGLVHCVAFAKTIGGFPPDYYYGLENVFYFTGDTSLVGPSISISDTGSYLDESFWGVWDEYRSDLDLLFPNGPVIAWSKQRRYLSDVRPEIDGIPMSHVGLISFGYFRELARIEGARNPKLATSSGGTWHLLWEALTPLRDTNYYFSRSEIMYARGTRSGTLRDSQIIGTGYGPIAASGINDTLVVSWLHADSSTSPVRQLQYAKGADGVFSAPALIHDSLMNPRLLGLSADRFGVVHVGWVSSLGYYPTFSYVARILPGGEIYKDSTLTADMRLTIDSAGNEYAVWSSYNDTTNRILIWYSSSRTGRLFSTMHAIHSTRILTHFSIHVSSRGQPVVVISDSAKILYIRVNEGRKDDEVSLDLNGTILNDRSVALDHDDNIRFVYGRTRPGYLSGVDTAWMVIVKDPLLSVEPSRSLPKGVHLEQNFPNPFNPVTTISYTIPLHTHVLLQVYNVLGQLVRTLVNTDRQAGTYRVSWDAGTRPSGMYFYRMTAGEFVQTRKAILIR